MQSIFNLLHRDLKQNGRIKSSTHCVMLDERNLYFETKISIKWIGWSQV